MREMLRASSWTQVVCQMKAICSVLCISATSSWSKTRLLRKWQDEYTLLTTPHITQLDTIYLELSKAEVDSNICLQMVLLPTQQLKQSLSLLTHAHVTSTLPLYATKVVAELEHQSRFSMYNNIHVCLCFTQSYRVLQKSRLECFYHFRSLVTLSKTHSAK